MKQIKQFYIRNQEWIDYIIFGALTTLVNIVVFFVLEILMNIPYLIANAIAIILSILFAFYTNKKFVFKSKPATFKESFREFYLFVGFRLVSGFFDMASMWLLVDILFVETNMAKILTQFIVLVLNYLFSKLIIFKRNEV